MIGSSLAGQSCRYWTLLLVGFRYTGILQQFAGITEFIRTKTKEMKYGNGQAKLTKMDEALCGLLGGALSESLVFGRASRILKGPGRKNVNVDGNIKDHTNYVFCPTICLTVCQWLIDGSKPVKTSEEGRRLSQLSLLQPIASLLGVEEEEEAYPFIHEPSFASTWCHRPWLRVGFLSLRGTWKRRLFSLSKAHGISRSRCVEFRHKPRQAQARRKWACPKRCRWLSKMMAF